MIHRLPDNILNCRAFASRFHWRLRDRLPIWVIYRPFSQDYRPRWVARMHISLPNPHVTRFVMLHDTLEGLRTNLPFELTFMPRSPDDGILVEEVWL